MTREEIWNKAFKRIFELYGENPDLKIVNRFLSEKAALAKYGAAEYFEELSSICKESLEKHNEKLIVKAPVASCFVSYLLGASEINPLPPHYICPSCRRVEWVNDTDCIFDMHHAHTCECGKTMRSDGYNIPYETYIPYASMLRVKDTVPESCVDLYESMLNAHFQKSFLNVAQVCLLLEQATGVSLDEIDLSDREVKYRLLSHDFSRTNPKLAILMQMQPISYNEMSKLIAISLGKSCTKEIPTDIKHIPATRDEVFTMIRDAMREHGVYDTGFAYDVANKARRGYYLENGMDEYTVEILKNLSFDDQVISHLLSARYLPTKTLSVMELRYIILMTYFKVYYPKEYDKIAEQKISE